MHEWALADGVVRTVLDAAKREGLRRIRRVAITIGELQRIERDVFRQALETVVPSDTRLASTVFDLKLEAVRFCCRSCSKEFGSADASGDLSRDEDEAIHFIPELAHAFLSCPDCRSPDFEVVRGRGVRIAVVEGE